MRVDHVLARRPGEHGEASVLRRDQRDRVALIVDELRGRQVPRAAERRGMHDVGASPPSIGSVTVACSTGGDPRRRVILAPKASSS